MQKDVKVDVMVIGGSVMAGFGLPWDVPFQFSKPNPRQEVGVRVAKALNGILEGFKLRLRSQYDFILKADGDTWFPQDFLARNVLEGYDAMGRGCGMLIRTQTFIDGLQGRFPELASDDGYIFKALEAQGYRVLPFRWSPVPAVPEREPKVTWRRLYHMGLDCYFMGYPLVTAAYWTARRAREFRLPLFSFFFLGAVVGYVRAGPRDRLASSIRAFELAGLKRRLRG